MRSTTHDDNARSWRDRRPTHSRTGVAGQRRSGRGLCRRPLPHELFAGARYGRLAPALNADDPDEPSIYLMAAAPPLSHEPLHFLGPWVRQDHHRSPSPHGPRPEAGRMLMARRWSHHPGRRHGSRKPHSNARAKQVTYCSRESLSCHLIQDGCGANRRSGEGAASRAVACGTVTGHRSCRASDRRTSVHLQRLAPSR